MERSAALKKIGAMLGKKFSYRIDDKAPMGDERATVKAEYTAAAAERDAITKQRDERRNALLCGDPEYQRLFAESKEADRKARVLAGRLASHKITVGVSSDMFFHVKAQGDSWEEVIGKITNDVKAVA